MAMDIYDDTNHDGLLNILGKAFKAIDTLNTARLTTIPEDVADFLAQFKLFADSASLGWSPTMDGLAAGLTNWQAGQGLAQQIARNCQQLLLQWAIDDGLPRPTLQTALDRLAIAMGAAGLYVDGNAVSFTLTADAGNAGDAAICYTAAGPDGLTLEHCLAEDIAVTVANAAASPTLRLEGEPAQNDPLREDWPLGSGAVLSLTATSGAASLLSNGDFEDETNADVPDNWIVRTGTPGTTVKITVSEVQTVAISGTPTGGSYVLMWTNPAGLKRATTTLAYNAPAGAVQAALRAIPGLEQVIVASTGDSPNYTHSVTFTGCSGDPAQLTSISLLTGGTPSITHGTSTAGTAGAYLGNALALTGNGSENTALYHSLTLEAGRVYFCHLRALAQSGVAAGAIKVEIVDGIDGSVTTDSAGNANSLTIDATALATSAHESLWFSFRLPAGTAWPVYLRVRVSTAITSGKTVWLDEMAITPGTQLYPGGPYIAVFSGRLATPATDAWTLAVANNRGGLLQEWFNRVFGTGRLGILLPVSGTDLVPDTVIA